MGEARNKPTSTAESHDFDRRATERTTIAQAVGATAISLEDATQGYADFDQGAAKKYVLNPNGYITA